MIFDITQCDDLVADESSKDIRQRRGGSYHSQFIHLRRSLIRRNENSFFPEKKDGDSSDLFASYRVMSDVAPYRCFCFVIFEFVLLRGRGRRVMVGGKKKEDNKKEKAC